MNPSDPRAMQTEGPSSPRPERPKVVVKLRGQSWEVEGNRRAREVVRELGLNPESYLIVRDGELITDDTLLRPGDRVELIAVISGGR